MFKSISALIALCALAACSSAPKPKVETVYHAEVSSFVVYDPASRSFLTSENADQAVVPASSIKVLTTYAAYKILGNAFRFRTELLARGRIAGGVLRGALILRGSGDPTLTSADLLDLAEQLRRQGVRDVKGPVYFDDRAVLPAARISEEVDREEPYNSPVSALDVDFNQLSDSEQRHPMADPARVAAGRFVQFARSMGMKLQDAERLPASALGGGGRRMALHLSASMDRMVRATLEFSNNLMAESLCIAAARKQMRKPVGMQDGARVAASELSRRFGVILSGETWRLQNCSGLGLGTQISARQYTAVLSGILEDRALPVYFGSLLNFSGPDFTALVKPGGLDYYASLGGVILTPSAPVRTFFIHYGSPGLREASRVKLVLERKSAAQEWAHYFRGEIRKKVGPYWELQ